jgi:hypothetical protein
VQNEKRHVKVSEKTVTRLSFDSFAPEIVDREKYTGLAWKVSAHLARYRAGESEYEASISSHYRTAYVHHTNE